MGFSKEWEDRYKESTHLSIWPWSDLISYVMNYARPTGEKYRVLELGCGAGANIPFFMTLPGVEYCAMEGSQTMVDRLKEKYGKVRDGLVCGDFTKEIPFSGSFDLIVDRGSLTHNTTASLRNCIKLIQGKLKDTGRFISIDWFSTEHSAYSEGQPDPADHYTIKNFTSGAMKNLGNVHFSDEENLRELFKDFEFVILDHKIIHREVPKNSCRYGAWDFVLKKK